MPPIPEGVRQLTTMKSCRLRPAVATIWSTSWIISYAKLAGEQTRADLINDFLFLEQLNIFVVDVPTRVSLSALLLEGEHASADLNVVTHRVSTAS